MSGGAGKGANLSLAAAEAAAAARRVEAARETGAQLGLFGPEGGPAPALIEEEARGPGRPAGTRNKVKSELRRWLGSRGMRMPEQQLASLALMDAAGGPFEAAMARAEELIAWGGGLPKGMGRVGLALELLRLARASAEAMLPYGLAKMTPDAVLAQQNVQIVMPSPAAAPAGSGQVVELAARRIAPPPLPKEIEAEQGVGAAAAAASDGAVRTDRGKS